MASDIPTFKTVIIGDGGVGKSAFVKKHNSGHFESSYVPTLGAEVTPLLFETSYGKMILEVWDCAGQPHFQGLCDGYYLSAKAAVVMFSLTDDQSVQSLPKRIDDLIRVVDTHYEEIPDPHTQEEVCQRVRVLDIPWVIVGNQVDHPTDRVDIRRQDKLLWLKHSSFVQSWQGSNFASYHISTMSGFNFNQPFLFLLRRLSGFSDLEIVPGDILLSQPDQMTSLEEVGTNNTSQSTSNELHWESTFEFESEFDTFEENPSWSFSFDPTPFISNLFPIDVDFQFTPEECALVESAWETQKDPQEILASCFGRNLRRQDLLCLKDGELLSDDIINPYFQLISSSCVHSMDAFFYFQLSTVGYEA